MRNREYDYEYRFTEYRFTEYEYGLFVEIVGDAWKMMLDPDWKSRLLNPDTSTLLRAI